MPYDVAIALRVYPGLPGGAIASQKEEIVRASLRSLRGSLGEVKAKIWVILDQCPPSYDDLILGLLGGLEPVLVRLDGAGNAGSFLKQMSILTGQNEGDLVYCLEDDYLHRPETIPVMLRFLREHQDVDFVSPYDHPDYGSMRLHHHRQEVRYSAGYRWFNRASTTLTFLTRRSILRETEKVFATFERRNYDASIWLSLTKANLFNPLVAADGLRSDRTMLKILAKAWLFGFRQILGGKSRTLWTPSPSMSTHMKTDMMPADHDWMGFFEKMRS